MKLKPLLISLFITTLCSCEISEDVALKISDEINNAYQNIVYLSLESHSYGYNPSYGYYYDIKETTESINGREFIHAKQEATYGETKYVAEAYIVSDNTYGEVTYFKKVIEGGETIEYAYVQNSDPDAYYNHMMDVYMCELGSYHTFGNLLSNDDNFVPCKKNNESFSAVSKVYASNKNRDLKVVSSTKYKMIWMPDNIKKASSTIIVKNYLVTSYKTTAICAVGEKEEKMYKKIKATYPSSLSIQLPPHWEEKINDA